MYYPGESFKGTPGMTKGGSVGGGRYVITVPDKEMYFSESDSSEILRA
jgi:hypothetical protein